ncbi:MAG TPA: hypothetical protein VG164_11760 [Trebonia sp.]|nr:hypothetical protein [Trebonia sp.]
MSPAADVASSLVEARLDQLRGRANARRSRRWSATIRRVRGRGPAGIPALLGARP